MQRYHADHYWDGSSRVDRARFEIDATGRIRAEAQEGPQGGERLGRFVLAGLPNIHSHAFQRAMAGLAERQTHADDSFWTWRELMYEYAGRIGPDDLQAIAAQLYVEMLEAGYTAVCEFHYLHHQPDGTPYDDRATMSLALLEAARETGIALTLLPTLYVTGGFDGRPLGARQRRFGHTVPDYLRLLGELRGRAGGDARIGVALHSLRAVPKQALDEVLHETGGLDLAIHIHIAEQIGEVQECVSLRGARPVEWLLDNAPVDARWTLVHATHMSAAETRAVAASGAVVALCPTTEANLGDGIFPLRDYLDAGGRLGIGSDSHISVSPVEELRWLEYGQRLAQHRRNVAVRKDEPRVGEALYAAACRGGRQAAALGEARTDLVVLDADAPQLAGRDADELINSWIFSGNRPLVKHVLAGGQWLVRDFRHRDRERIAQRYRDVIERLRR